MQKNKFVNVHIPVIQIWFTQYVQYIATYWHIVSALVVKL